MLPHFQIGLFRDQLFVMFGVMHEAKNKANQMKVFKSISIKLKTYLKTIVFA